jgi:4-amino-4-deoxy-L-arabinose transferase-like glycosyltransferase
MNYPINLRGISFLLLMLVFTVLVLWSQISHPGIYLWDESRQAVNAIEMLIYGDPLITHFNGKPDLWNTKPPILIWLMAGSISLFGPNVVAIRLPSALAALGTILVLVRFCFGYLGDWRKACLSGFILTTSVGFIGCHVAATADYDALLVLWETLYCFLFFGYLKDENKHWKLYLSAMCLCGALLTKGIAGGLCLPGLVIYALWKRKLLMLVKQPRLYGALFVVIAVIVGYYLLREQANTGYLQSVFTNEVGGRFTAQVEKHGGSITKYLYLLTKLQFVPWVYALPLCLWIGLFSRDARIREVIAFCVVCSSAFLVVISLAQTKLTWYDAPAIPFLAIVVASGLVDMRDLLSERFSNKSVKRLVEPIFLITAFAFIVVLAFHLIHKDRQFGGSSEPPYALILQDMKRLAPNKDKHFVVLEDDQFADPQSPTYTPQLLFYASAAQLHGYTIEVSSMKQIWISANILISCNANVLQELSKLYRVKQLQSTSSCGIYAKN